MEYLNGSDGWSLLDSLKLLTLRKNDVEWADVASQLIERYGREKEPGFYNEESCKERYNQIVTSPHPEHFLRHKGKKYSQKDLLQAWIMFFEKKVNEERARKRQLLLIQFREKLNLFNKLFDDKCEVSNGRVAELLEEARKEDSGRNQKVVESGIARLLPKIEELSNLHRTQPEVYGCLRLVVPVPQLCELESDQVAPEGSVEKPTSPNRSSMSLRSASQSPQKSSGIQSPQRSAGSQSPQKTPAQSPQKTPVQSPQKTPTTTPSKQPKGRVSPQKPYASPVKERSPIKTPFTSPAHRSYVSSPTGVGDADHVPDISGEVDAEEGGSESCSNVKGTEREVAAAVPDVPVDPVFSQNIVQEGDAQPHVVIKEEPTQMEVDGIDPDVSGGPGGIITADQSGLNTREVGLNSSADTLLPDPEKNSPIEIARPHKISESTLNEEGIAVESESGQRSPEKRQLRSSRKESTATDTQPLSTRTPRSQRSSSRKVSSSVGDTGADEVVQPAFEHGKRRTSGTSAGGIESPTHAAAKPDESRVASLRSHTTEDKPTEGVEEVSQRRRSDRLRGTEAAEQQDVKPIVSKRKATVSSDLPEDEQVLTTPVMSRKRRRLNLESTQEDVEAAGSASPTKGIEQIEDDEKRKIKVEVVDTPVSKKDKKAPEGKAVLETTTRRSSLRSAVQGVQEGIRVDSDEERTLVDLREKHRSPRKLHSDARGGKNKYEDVPKRRSGVSDEETSDVKAVDEQTQEVSRGTGRRGRFPRRSVPGAMKSESQSPKKQTPEKKHPKRKDSEDGSTEKKIFLMSAWRLVSSHRHAAIFAHPVSERDAQGYAATVKRRMDLATLKKNVESGEVRDLGEFKRRLLLMFANAVMFNSTGHDVNMYAKEMATDTLNSLKDLEKDILYVRGGTHVTRRSAAFAAEEERRRIVSSTPIVVPQKAASVKDTSEDAQSINSQKSTPVKKVIGKLK